MLNYSQSHPLSARSPVTATNVVTAGAVVGTHTGHEVVRTPHPGDLVLVEQLLDEALRRLVDLHEQHVRHVDAQQQRGLVPLETNKKQVCVYASCRS